MPIIFAIPIYSLPLSPFSLVATGAMWRRVIDRGHWQAPPLYLCHWNHTLCNISIHVLSRVISLLSSVQLVWFLTHSTEKNRDCGVNDESCSMYWARSVSDVTAWWIMDVIYFISIIISKFIVFNFLRQCRQIRQRCGIQNNKSAITIPKMWIKCQINCCLL